MEGGTEYHGSSTNLDFKGTSVVSGVKHHISALVLEDRMLSVTYRTG